MKRLGLGCIGFTVTLALGMFLSLAALDLTGNLESDDAQIPIFPVLIVLPLAALAGYFASRPLTRAESLKKVSESTSEHGSPAVFGPGSVAQSGTQSSSTPDDSRIDRDADGED